ncbi:MAG: WD40 repeat domain-containing protein [Verrucomicrobia bacterium]|nr:WD40 repeat domain-containing protein [Verrucomicrobiota bacterium]
MTTRTNVTAKPINTSETTTFQTPAPQASGLVNLSSEVIFKILGMLSIQHFGVLNQTCRKSRLITTTNPLTILLSQYFPNFRKTDPSQTDLQALKEQHRINSNLTNGVYRAHTLQGQSGTVNSLALDGQRLISSSHNKTIKIWDLNTNTCTATLKRHSGSVTSLALDGQRLFSGSEDKTIKVWDLNKSKFTSTLCTATLKGHSESVTSLALDGQTLFSGSADKTIKVWDLNTNTCTATLKGHDGSVLSLALDGQRLFSSSYDKTIKIWDLNTNTCTATLKEHSHRVDSLAVDGQRLFSGSLDKTIKIWDLNTNTCTATLKGHDSSVFSLALGRMRLFSGSYDNMIKIWDLNTNTCTATLKGHDSSVFSLALDGQRLFSGSYKTIKIWDFNAPDEAVFHEIADSLKSETPAIVKDAMDRFDRMPTKAKNAIYGELYSIMAPFANDYPGCAKDAFHNQNGQSSTPEQREEAIFNYLAKRSVIQS